MTIAFSQQNSVSLCPASFCTKAKLSCYSRYHLISYFCIPISYDEKDIFLWCLFQEVLQIFIESFNFSFFVFIGWGIDLDYCDVEQFALGNEPRSFCHFQIAPKYCVSDSSVDFEGYSIASKGFLPTVVHIMVICIKFAHSRPFYLDS